MELLRLIHPDMYSGSLGRFTSECLRNPKKHRDGTPLSETERGITVLDSDCIRRCFPSQSICGYISERYGHTGAVGIPILYWRLPVLPSYVEVAGEEGTDSDPCHRNLKNFPDTRSKKFFGKDFREADVRCCPTDMKGDGFPFDVAAL